MEKMTSGPSSVSMGKEIHSTTATVSIPAGGNANVNINVDHSTFTGLRAIVASYVTAGGQTVDNGFAEIWTYAAMGGKICTSGSEAADAVAADESFGLTVTTIFAVQNVRDISITYKDNLAFVIKNTSGQTVTDFTIRFLGFDANGKYSKVDCGGNWDIAVSLGPTSSVKVPGITCSDV